MHQVTESFKVNSAIPIDARFTIDTLANLLLIPSYKIYDGIIVYVNGEKCYYTYDSNIAPDPSLGHWRKMEVLGVNIKKTEIDTNGHLIVTLNDNSTQDLGLIKGPQGDKGDKGDGFAITRIYDSQANMVGDTTPVLDGQMVACTEGGAIKVYVRNTLQTAGGNNLAGYTYLTNLADSAVIKGDKGDKGDDGKDAPIPVITATPFAQTATNNAGYEVKIVVDDPTNPTTYKVYDGSSPTVTTQAVAATPSTPSGNKITIKNGINTYQFTVYNGIDGTNGTNGIAITDIKVDNDENSATYHHILVTLSNNSIVDAGPIDIEVENLDFLIEVVEELPVNPEEGKIYVLIGDATTGGGGAISGGGGGNGVGSGAIFVLDFYKTSTLPAAGSLQPGDRVADTDVGKLYTVNDLYVYQETDLLVDTLYANKADNRLYIWKDEKMIVFSTPNPIHINSFTVSGYTPNKDGVVYIEKGTTISSLTFSWTTNKPTTQVLLTGCNPGETDTSATFSTPITSNKTFKLIVQDVEGNEEIKEITFKFVDKIYYGSSVIPTTYDSTFVLGLSNSEFSVTNDFDVTMTVASNQYGYIALPYSISEVYIYNLPTTLESCGTISFTNSSGGKSTYYIYKTYQAGLGKIKCELNY